jgi:hypothetical protein
MTTDSYWNLTIQVQSVNTSTSLPYVGYQIKEDYIYNGSVVSTYTERNLTTIFDPFDSETYLGNLGFPAFVFTDVTNGSKTFGFNVPTTSLPSWTSINNSVPQNITVAVVRTPAAIYVSLRDTVLNASFMVAAVTYNPATGIMEKSSMYTVLGGVYKDFFYTLLSSTKSGPSASSAPGTPYLWYIAVGVTATAVAVIGISRRPSRRQRKVDRMRKK